MEKKQLLEAIFSNRENDFEALEVLKTAVKEHFSAADCIDDATSAQISNLLASLESDEKGSSVKVPGLRQLVASALLGALKSGTLQSIEADDVRTVADALALASGGRGLTPCATFLSGYPWAKWLRGTKRDIPIGWSPLELLAGLCCRPNHQGIFNVFLEWSESAVRKVLEDGATYSKGLMPSEKNMKDALVKARVLAEEEKRSTEELQELCKKNCGIPALRKIDDAIKAAPGLRNVILGGKGDIVEHSRDVALIAPFMFRHASQPVISGPLPAMIKAIGPFKVELSGKGKVTVSMAKDRDPPGKSVSLDWPPKEKQKKKPQKPQKPQKTTMPAKLLGVRPKEDHLWMINALTGEGGAPKIPARLSGLTGPFPSFEIQCEKQGPDEKQGPKVEKLWHCSCATLYDNCVPYHSMRSWPPAPKPDSEGKLKNNDQSLCNFVMRAINGRTVTSASKGKAKNSSGRRYDYYWDSQIVEREITQAVKSLIDKLLLTQAPGEEIDLHPDPRMSDDEEFDPDGFDEFPESTPLAGPATHQGEERKKELMDRWLNSWPQCAAFEFKAKKCCPVLLQKSRFDDWSPFGDWTAGEWKTLNDNLESSLNVPNNYTDEVKAVVALCCFKHEHMGNANDLQKAQEAAAKLVEDDPRKLLTEPPTPSSEPSSDPEYVQKFTKKMLGGVLSVEKLWKAHHGIGGSIEGIWKKLKKEPGTKKDKVNAPWYLERLCAGKVLEVFGAHPPQQTTPTDMSASDNENPS